MGLVLQANQGLLRSYAEETIPWRKALIEPGKAEAAIKLAPLDSDEVELILTDLDQLCMSAQHEGIAKMVAEESESILTAIRMVKTETKSPYTGILGVGANLGMMWLRPKNVGETATLNKDATAGLGLYQGTSGGVYTWLHPFVANTSAQIIPEQTMSEEAAVIHLGMIDPMEIPKVNAMKVTLAGIPAPAQSLAFNIRESLGTNELPFVRFVKPIIVGPEKKQKLELMPYITGDSKPELMSILVARAQDLTV